VTSKARSGKARPGREGGAPIGDVEAEVRRGFETGHPSAAFWDDWPALAALADREPHLLASLLSAASGPESPNASGARVEGEAVAFGMIDPGGRLLRGSDRFRAWVGEPVESIDCLELARKAAAHGRASGRVRTLRHGVLAALAIADPSTSPWPGLAQQQDFALGDKGVLLVVFAPSRSHILIGRAADALGFSPLQRQIALALMDEPSLEAAALSLKIGRETAKDALESALQKAGVRRSSQLIGRLLDLSCRLTDTPANHGAAAAAALGLSRGEAAVAERIAEGDTVEEAAVALALKPGTVKAYRRSIFDKLGINRSRDLKRLIAEAGELARLSTISELEPHRAPEGDLRVFNGADGRTVACLDYGPARGRPLLLMHGFWTGRLAPPPLLAALVAAGRRVIVPQRPGFGLTSAAATDYLGAASKDMALVLDRLGCRAAAVLARDGGASVALAFGAAFPERLERGVLLNPRRPMNLARGRSPFTALSALLLRHPALIEPYARLRLRQGNRAAVIGGFRRAFAATPADSACFDQPEVAGHLAADRMGLVGRSLRGAITEQRLYSDGWRIADPYMGPRWRLAFSGHFYTPGEEAFWSEVAAGAPVILLEAGLLAQFTHAEALAALFAK